MIRRNEGVYQSLRIKHQKIQLYLQNEYKVGDKVKFLDKTTKKSDSKKFKRKWKGPCDVLERTSPANYKIKPRNGRVRIEHVI